MRILMAIGKFRLQWQCDAATSPCPLLSKEGIEKRNEGSLTRFPDELNNNSPAEEIQAACDRVKKNLTEGVIDQIVFISFYDIECRYYKFVHRSEVSMPSNTQEPTGQMVRQFFLGFVKIHILHHAAEESVCGVDLAQELSGHGYRLSPGTLYPTLHGLEAAGYLQCHVELQSGRRRKTYTITRAGLKALTQARRQIRELTKEVMKGAIH